MKSGRFIKEGAIFIADSHDGEVRDSFFIFLKKLEKKEIKTTQLFLMGDMFDLLTKLSYTKEIYKEYIDLINILSKEIEIFYFEGNHDFLLKDIFPNLKIFTLKEQPALFFYEDKKFLLSHGDWDENLGYQIYSYLIRNNLTAKIVDFIDKIIGYKFSKRILNIQYNKKICKDFQKFQEKISQKITKYRECDYIIEGHFHQGKTFKFKNVTYINISSLSCSKKYTLFNKNLSFNGKTF